MLGFNKKIWILYLPPSPLQPEQRPENEDITVNKEVILNQHQYSKISVSVVIFMVSSDVEVLMSMLMYHGTFGYSSFKQCHRSLNLGQNY